MKKLISLIAIIFLLAGCVAQYKTLKIGEVNKNDKSITVPGVGNALFEIKSALLADGWKVKIDNASLHEKGVHKGSINTKTSVTFDTAYRMYMTSTLSNNKRHGIVIFNISIVNNKNNEEVLNMAGNRQDYIRYKPEDIASNMMKALKELER